MPSIHVKSGIEFKPDLFTKTPDHAEWIDAVGAEIASRGLTVKVGDGATARDVKDAATLKDALTQLNTAAAANGVGVKEYLADLMEALDDVVKPTSQVMIGDVLDLGTNSDVSKALGLGDPAVAYASAQTDFGSKAVDGALNVLNVRLQNKPDPLAGVQFIDDATYQGTETASGRDDIEVEAVRAATGISKEDLYKMITTVEKNGKTVLQKLQKNRDTVAFGIGYDGMAIDEVNWDSDAAKVRQLNPYISLTVESGRMEVDPKTGDREISVGRDTFFDIFYATKNPVTGKLTRDLLDNNVMIRSRLRIDDESGTPTRILIGEKIGTEVDTKYGVKSDAKGDIRTDSPVDDTVTHLDESVKTGKVRGDGWWQTGAVIAPLAQVYTYMKSKKALRTYGTHKDTLVLDQAACARQVRGRYHLNETEPQALQDAFKKCGEKLGDILAAINGSPTLDAAKKAELAAKCTGLIDHSEIAKRATAELQKLDPTMTTVDVAAINTLWPDAPFAGGDAKLDAKKRKVVADTINSAYREFTGLLTNDLEKAIAGNADDAVKATGGLAELKGFMQAKANASAFMTWAQTQTGSGVVVGQPATFAAYLAKINAMHDADKLKLLANSGLATEKLASITPEMLSTLQVPANLERVQTVGPFLEQFDAMLAGTDKAAFVAEFAAYLSANGNDALKSSTNTDATLADIRKNVVFGNLEVLHRMVEESGTLAQTLWFDSARSAYCDVTRSGWSNFIIDSFDLIEEYDLKNGLALTKEQRASRKPLDPKNMLDFKVGNDFQIELGFEVPYTTAIDKASSRIDVAAGGMFMDYALQKADSGVVKDDPATFTAYLAKQMKLKKADRTKFEKDVAAFAKSKGSPLAMDDAMLKSVLARAQTVDLMTAYAQTQTGSNVTKDPATLQTWLQTQTGWNTTDDKKREFLNNLSVFFAESKHAHAFSDKELQAFDVTMFAPANQAQPTTDHAQRLEDLQMAQFVWSTLMQAQETVADFRGQRVIAEAKKQGYDIRWEAPKGSKGGETVEKVLS